MAEDVMYQVEDGIATITLNRPANRNALSPEVVNGLGDALAIAHDNSAVRVVVLTNNGPAFCAGADLKGGSDVEPRFTLPELFDLIQLGPLPVIGRIGGHCTGGGVGLAAACDISIAADDVFFGFTEVRVGVAPAMISVVCLPKMRRADALELFLSGEKIKAKRAVEVGLINRVVAPDQLNSEVKTVVQRLAQGGPQALALAKRLVFEVPGMDRGPAFEWTREKSIERFQSAEAAEGMAAFREKRPASWIPE